MKNMIENLRHSRYEKKLLRNTDQYRVCRKLVFHKADVRQCYDITVYHHVLGHEFTTIPQQKSFKKLAVYNTIQIDKWNTNEPLEPAVK